MSSLDMQTTQGQAESVQPGTQQAQAPVRPGQNPSMGTVPGLPPTALSMQMQSLNDQYAQAQQQAQGGGGMTALGAEMQTGGPLMIDREGGRGLGEGQFARTSLSDMAERLARSYGLNFSRGSLVDPEGNFMMTPDQLATLQGPGGGDMGMIAADMNRIAQAINDRQVEMQQNKATAALQTGMGQIQQRGRGSLAAMQSNFYQQMAANYTDPNLLPEQADFSFWIQKAGFDEAAANREKEDAATGGGGGTGTKPYGGAPVKTRREIGDMNPYKDPQLRMPEGTVTGPEGKGDVVTSGPHAGQRPVYTYDPISKTTTVSWEDA